LIMICEFAIEPELVATWGKLENFRFFCNAFGIGQPRLMSEFPKVKNWRRRVLHAAHNLEDFELKRVGELLIFLLSEKVISRNRSFDGEIDWLSNAENEHMRIPFHGILARTNPNGHSAVIVGDHVGTVIDPRWDLPRALTPKRQAKDLAAALREMLHNCSEVIFIDPHFGPENARHRRPLETLINTMLEARAPGNIPSRIEVQTGVKSSENFFIQECNQRLPKLIPLGVSIRIVRIKERLGGEKVHQRYILTDLGGVRIDPGIDDGQPGETYDINLMDRSQFDLRWKQYASDTPAFDYVDEVLIWGIAKSQV
jgi:hypothetical protein